jgi:hypothetical protein
MARGTKRKTPLYDPTHGPLYEYKTLSSEGPLPREQIEANEANGYELFNVVEPAMAMDKTWSYHLRRRIE